MVFRITCLLVFTTTALTSPIRLRAEASDESVVIASLRTHEERLQSAVVGFAPTESMKPATIPGRAAPKELAKLSKKYRLRFNSSSWKYDMEGGMVFAPDGVVLESAGQQAFHKGDFKGLTQSGGKIQGVVNQDDIPIANRFETLAVAIGLRPLSWMGIDSEAIRKVLLA